MCGIMGIFGERVYTDKIFFSEIAKNLNRRGPDAEGFFYSDNCYLGHKRLSIIDLKSGAQPMHSENNRYVISFNGEIYNFKKLKKELDNYKFTTNSDTEVLLASYKQFGEKMLDKIEGMYAFAIYDKKENSIFLARDPLGIKPLVYANIDGKFVFASEIKALLPFFRQKLNIDEQAVFDFFCLKYIPAPRTIYREIKKLSAGSYIKLNLNSVDKISQIKYWQPEYSSEHLENVNIDKLREMFLKTVEDHLISDVEIGAFLSGGIDSTSIVWAMKELGIEPNTFTVGFSQFTNDKDIEYSKLVAKHFGTNHRELSIGTSEYVTDAREMVEYFDEPFADPASISNWYVAKATSEHVKVVLSGDGGDELFFGYNIYSKFYKKNIISRLLNRNINILENYFGFDMDSNQELLNSEIKLHSLSDKIGNKDKALEMRNFDLKYTLPEYYLRKTDASSMTNSLEVRVPFCYRPFVEKVLRISYQDHFAHNKGKAILRKMLDGKIPKEIINRKKQGFSRPVHLLFNAQNQKFLKQVLTGSGLFNTSILDLILDYNRKQKKLHPLSWRLLVFAFWFDKNKKIINV